jgi:hypothetical protein
MVRIRLFPELSRKTGDRALVPPEKLHERIACTSNARRHRGHQGNQDGQVIGSDRFSAYELGHSKSSPRPRAATRPTEI